MQTSSCTIYFYQKGEGKVIMKQVATNKKAYHNYFVLKTFEAGISLVGCEVKSIRQGEISLADSFVVISKDDEIFVKNMYIKPYEKTTAYVPDARRSRKLLMHKSEIQKLHARVKEKGLTLMILSVYFNGKRVKLEVGLCQGKHTYDKKKVLAEKDRVRDMQREIKNYTR